MAQHRGEIMSVVVLVYMLLSCITAVVVPWVGIIFYYLLAIGQPEDMWPHHFGEGNRISLFISLSVLLGLGLATATRQVDWRRLVALPNLALMFVVVAFNISIAVSPFADFFDVKINKLSSAEMLEILNKIMIIYFAAVLLIDTRFKLICLISSIGGIFLYYTLWANKIYFTGEFWRFGDNGRLNGPWGMYYDENYLAMLFVLCTPIFYYLSVGTSYRVIRYGLWLCIPLSWHALFLTGSRGALLALGVTCMYVFFRSYSKKASLILFVGLAVAIVDQSGNMINRITDTVSVEELERERAFIENTEDSPEINGKAVDPRLISWQVGLSIMRDYPLLGVGAANFMRAWPEYEESEPHVAHNTFIQFGTACGVGAALVYLYFLILRLKNMVTKPDPEKKFAHGHPRDYLDDLLNSLFIAFYTVALFLDLMIIELTYFIFIVGTCKYCLEKRKKTSFRSLIGSIYRWRQETDVEEVVVRESAYASSISVPEPAAVQSESAIYAMEAEREAEAQQEVVEGQPRSQYATAPSNQYASTSVYAR